MRNDIWKSLVKISIIGLGYFIFATSYNAFFSAIYSADMNEILTKILDFILNAVYLFVILPVFILLIVYAYSDEAKQVWR